MGEALFCILQLTKLVLDITCGPRTSQCQTLELNRFMNFVAPAQTTSTPAQALLMEKEEHQNSSVNEAFFQEKKNEMGTRSLKFTDHKVSAPGRSELGAVQHKPGILY